MNEPLRAVVAETFATKASGHGEGFNRVEGLLTTIIALLFDAAITEFKR
jgi:hypothetical protein